MVRIGDGDWWFQELDARIYESPNLIWSFDVCFDLGVLCWFCSLFGYICDFGGLLLLFFFVFFNSLSVMVSSQGVT